MNKKIGNVLKQRIREAVWKTGLNSIFNATLSREENITKRLKLHYRETQVIQDDPKQSNFLYIRGKCVIEVLEKKDNIKDHMTEHNLPGVQVSFQTEDSPTIQFLCWYDNDISEDGELETLTTDPEGQRCSELTEETKSRLKAAFQLVSSLVSSDKYINIIHSDLKASFAECYKQRYVNDTLMPDITIMEVCVIDITNRNRGLVMSPDIKKMGNYMNELLIPGVLVNFTDGRLSTILWFSCKDNKTEMTIEAITDDPEEPNNLHLDEMSKDVIRLAVEDVNKDKSLRTESEYKEKLFQRLKLVYKDCYKDQYQDGQMADITIENLGFIDVKARCRGIITLKDKEMMKQSMNKLKWPGTQIIFIEQTFAIILWFGFKDGNTIIETESQGKDESGASLIEILQKNN